MMNFSIYACVSLMVMDTKPHHMELERLHCLLAGRPVLHNSYIIMAAP